ncbi:MAG: hypothetical protein FJY07_04400 [Bacteroidetes bacterium]|nr:hypothetical protein [Bacteroidota bacterium]
MRFLFLTVFSSVILLQLRPQNFITPAVVTTLTSELNENSGLVNLNGEIWTHNDYGGDSELYQINLSDGSIIRTVDIHEADNVDWEDLACDEEYVYIGDFGNNDGSRTNLRVYRISRSEMLTSNDVDAEKIKFAYSDQTNFEPNYHNTNFDCEAMISFQDHLYLFTKNWIDNKTNLYEMPDEPGTHIAQYLATFDVSCLITGAEAVFSLNTLLLTGYNESGGTYTWIFNNFDGVNFFDGNNTKLIWTTLTQTEGICYDGTGQAFASSEKLAGVLEPTLFTLDLSGYMTQIESNAKAGMQIFVERNELVIQSESGKSLSGILQILSLSGTEMLRYEVRDMNKIVLKPAMKPGICLVHWISESFNCTTKVFIAP